MVVGIFIFLQVLFSVLVMVFVLMHSGRDSGLGSIGGGATQGGQHVMERNLDRITVIASLLYVLNTLILQKIYN